MEKKMKRTILPCKKCGKLVNVKLPAFASGRDKRQGWGNNLTVTGRNLSKGVFAHLFICISCGGKYN